MGDDKKKTMNQDSQEFQNEDPKSTADENLMEEDMAYEEGESGKLGGVADYDYSEIDEDVLVTPDPKSSSQEPSESTTVDEMIEDDEDALVR